MKFSQEKDKDRLRKALAAAYRKKEEREIGKHWQIRVMEHIRDLAPLHARAGYLELFETSFWQLAPVACLLIFILGMAIARLDFVSDYEIVKMLMEDPLDLSSLLLY
jgi:hypothetical protein